MDETLGSLFYLINKVFFLLREIAGLKKYERLEWWFSVASWTSGLIGLPFVSLLFLHQNDYIFAWLELGAGTPMAYGLILKVFGVSRNVPIWVDRIVDGAIGFGLGYSICFLGGFVTIDQGLELTAVLMFLRGNHYLAKDDRTGYLWFLPMFCAAGALLYRQGNVFFFCQQVASFVIIFAACLMSKMAHAEKAATLS
jgi:hypothetical protein